jgi:protocatechuate 3,4-dioxygenase alpha subunit
MTELGLTPSQTVGPFLHIGLPWPDGPDVVATGSAGAVLITGRVVDGAGLPVPDALIETWQADPDGRFTHPDDPRADDGRSGGAAAFRGFGRCATDVDGTYHIVTCKPGRLPAPDGAVEAPHIDVSVLGRGLLDRLVTRVYFADEPAANAADPVLATVDPARLATLLAERTSDGYRFDIRLQGPGETVFFDV